MPELFFTMIEIPLQIIELENENFHILIEGNFQDGTASNWIIDTGASKTVLDSNLTQCYESIEANPDEDYQSAGINQGMLDTTVGMIPQLQFGELMMTNQKVALINLNHVNEIYEKFASYKISGLLGGDILMQYKCIIDYKRKVIRFHNKRSFQVSKING
jgi:hypothetical protein